MLLGEGACIAGLLSYEIRSSIKELARISMKLMDPECKYVPIFHEVN